MCLLGTNEEKNNREKKNMLFTMTRRYDELVLDRGLQTYSVSYDSTRDTLRKIKCGDGKSPIATFVSRLPFGDTTIYHSSTWFLIEKFWDLKGPWSKYIKILHWGFHAPNYELWKTFRYREFPIATFDYRIITGGSHTSHKPTWVPWQKGPPWPQLRVLETQKSWLLTAFYPRFRRPRWTS